MCGKTRLRLRLRRRHSIFVIKKRREAEHSVSRTFKYYYLIFKLPKAIRFVVFLSNKMILLPLKFIFNGVFTA